MANKGKNPRTRSMKALRRRRMRSKKFKHSKWKLNYPKIFKLISYYPFIVRREDTRYKSD